MKLAIIGGGGMRMPAFVRAVLTGRPRLFEQIRLFEPDPARRETICRLAAQVGSALGRPDVVRVTADPAEAFTGADHVFAAIRVGGDRGRVIDEEVALRRGIVGQETTGPGGCAMALRTIPVMLGYCDLLSRCAPDATLVNFTNPVGLITQAIHAQGKVRAVGVCDTPGDTLERLSAFLGAGQHHIAGAYAGLNHLGWVCAFPDGGKDRLGELLDRFEELQRFDHRFAAFDPAQVRRLGAIPTEYVYYFYDTKRYLDRVSQAGSSRGAEVARLNAKLLDGIARAFAAGDPDGAWAVYDQLMGVRGDTYMRADMQGASGQDRFLARRAAAGPTPVAQTRLGGYEALALRVIEGLAGHGASDVIVNLPEGHRLGLETGDVVEIPARVGAGGPAPLPTPRLPRPARALVAQVKEYERGAVEAALTGDATLAAVALAEHPLVPGITAARELISEYRERHGPLLAYLR